MKIAIKKVNKPIEIIETTKKYRGDCVKEYINNTADYVHLNSFLSVAVDEEGLPKELPTNFLIKTKNTHFPIQKMVGTAVFTRIKPITGEGEIWDYEIDELKDDDIKMIEILTNEKYQEKLKESFNDYGKGYLVITPIKH